LEQLLQWVERSWPYLVPWLLFVAALVAALRNAYAAERDRQALKQITLEREKLSLEIHRLRNSPEVVADRCAIYERLRRLISEILRDVNVTREHIAELHASRHDCEFRFPDEITQGIQALIENAVQLHVTREIMGGNGRSLSEEKWRSVCDREHRNLEAIISYEKTIVDTFRPHLSP
jgi:hypothetical protein